MFIRIASNHLPGTQFAMLCRNKTKCRRWRDSHWRNITTRARDGVYWQLIYVDFHYLGNLTICGLYLGNVTICGLYLGNATICRLTLGNVNSCRLVLCYVIICGLTIGNLNICALYLGKVNICGLTLGNLNICEFNPSLPVLLQQKPLSLYTRNFRTTFGCISVAYSKTLSGIIDMVT